MRIFFIFLLIMASCLATANETKNIYITYPDKALNYQVIAQKLSDEIKGNTHSSEITINNIIIKNSELPDQNITKTDLVVSLNNTDIQELIPNIAINNILFTFSTSIQKPKGSSKLSTEKYSIIYIDQMPFTLLNTAKKTIKNNYKNKVLAIVDENNNNGLSRLKKLATNNKDKFKIIVIKENETAAKAIEPELFNAAAIMAIYDPNIWSGNSARWILQQAYNHQVPVIGYSKAFLKAGAMVSVYSSADQVIKETEKQIDYWLRKGQLQGKATYPEYTIEVNDNIARALDFSKAEIIEIGNHNDF